jgi:hypothetical protein
VEQYHQQDGDGGDGIDYWMPGIPHHEGILVIALPMSAPAALM